MVRQFFPANLLQKPLLRIAFSLQKYCCFYCSFAYNILNMNILTIILKFFIFFNHRQIFRVARLAKQSFNFLIFQSFNY